MKYCEKFKAATNKFSARGQEWMVDTMECLQKELVPEAIEAQGAATTCAALEEKAFDSHSRCYVQSGVCTLPPTDWETILRVVGLGTLFGSWNALKEARLTLAGCANSALLVPLTLLEQFECAIEKEL